MKEIKELADIRTIDINTYTWYDKTYGNTYFAQSIVLNYGMENEKELINPFQYGYSSYRYEAFKCIAKHFKTSSDIAIDCFTSDCIIREYTREEKQRFLKNLGKCI